MLVKQEKRNETGSIVAAAVGLGIIATMTVVAVCFLVNTGSAFYFAEKYNFVCTQAAQNAVTLARWNEADRDPSRDVIQTEKDIIKQLCNQMSLKEPSRITVSNGQNSIEVALTVRDLKLPETNAALPSTTGLQESVSLTFSEPPAWVNIFPKGLATGDRNGVSSGNKTKIVGVPAYGIFVQGRSDTGTKALGASSDTIVLRNFDFDYNAFNMNLLTPLDFQEGSGTPTVMGPIFRELPSQ